MGAGDIKFGADMQASAALKEVQRLSKELGKLQKKFDGLAKSSKKGTTEKLALDKKQIELDKQRKRVLEQIMTPQERYNRKMKELGTLLGHGKLSQDQYWRSVRKTQAELKGAGKAAVKAFGPQTLAMVKGLAGSLGLGFGVAGAISLVNRGVEAWEQNIRRVGTAANKATGDMIAFLALQAGGTKAEAAEQAATLGARYGVPAGEAFYTVQALQSAKGGDLGKGLKAAETVFAAGRVGVPVERGRELEVVGAALQAKPGATLRRAYAAGQASARDPALLAGAAPGMQFWKDQDVGFAAAGVLAAPFGDDLKTYLKRGGMALSATGPLQPMFKKAGMGKATQMQRLEKLAEMDLTTPEALEAKGVTEMREQQALAFLVSNIGEVRRILAAIRQQAKPGLFGAQLAAVEAEIPRARETRISGSLGAEYQKETSMGKYALPAQRELNWMKARAVAGRRLGYESSIWGDIYTGEGEDAMMTSADMRQLTLGGRPWAAESIHQESRRILFAKRFRLPISKEAGEWSPEFERAYGMYKDPQLTTYARNEQYQNTPAAELPAELATAIIGLQAAAERSNELLEQLVDKPELVP